MKVKRWKVERQLGPVPTSQVEVENAALKIEVAEARTGLRLLSWFRSAQSKYSNTVSLAMAQLSAVEFRLKVVVAELAGLRVSHESLQQRQVQLQQVRNEAVNDSLEAAKVSRAIGCSLRGAEAQCANMTKALALAVSQASAQDHKKLERNAKALGMTLVIGFAPQNPNGVHYGGTMIISMDATTTLNKVLDETSDITRLTSDVHLSRAT